jgi:hypothetical protein
MPQDQSTKQVHPNSSSHPSIPDKPGSSEIQPDAATDKILPTIDKRILQ